MKSYCLVPPVGTRCRVTVPGSTSNLGSGFDAIGCAVALENVFEFEILPAGSADVVTLGGVRPQGIPTHANNLALECAREFFRRQGLCAPPLRLHAEINVPSARGLGSSSTAIVAGLFGANMLFNEVLSRQQVLDIAVETEGHPDNVAPAILGGLVVSASECRPLAYRRLAVHPSVHFIFVVPDYEVRTSEARARLPKEVPYKDAIFNLSRSPLLVMALLDGNLEHLGAAIDDRLHQPYRKPLFKGYDALATAAVAAGAAGFCVSGAGPTMLAICSADRRERVTAALRDRLASLGLGGFVEELAPNDAGTRGVRLA